MAERFRTVETEPVGLGLAVKPVDAVTGKRLETDPSVSIEGVEYTPVVNPSGYHLFLSPPVSLPPDPVTVHVSAGPRYVPGTYEIVTGDLAVPGDTVDVYRSTAFRFASGRTLVQGTVEDGSGDPVSWAAVGVDNTALETRTDTDGTFVLLVEGIVHVDSTARDAPLRVGFEDDEVPLTVGPDTVLDTTGSGDPATPTLTVSHPDHGRASVTQSITEGEHTIRSAPVEL